MHNKIVVAITASAQYLKPYFTDEALRLSESFNPDSSPDRPAAWEERRYLPSLRHAEASNCYRLAYADDGARFAAILRCRFAPIHPVLACRGSAN